eukprot:jgi/Mesen1/6277/ME000324S05315
MGSLVSQGSAQGLDAHHLEHVRKFHDRKVGAEEAYNVVYQPVRASPEAVWSVLRDFHRPQRFRWAIGSCELNLPEGEQLHAGVTRRMTTVTGIPGSYITERLDWLCDEERVLGYTIIDTDFRLEGCHTVISVHKDVVDGEVDTLVIQSYVITPPQGNSQEETVLLLDTIVKQNLKNLAESSKQAELSLTPN